MKTRWKPIGASGFCTFFLLIILLAMNSYSPFGTNSFAQVDASIQYLDLFSYLKHLLQGEASWTFSFARGIGGNVWVILTYYLTSPWNILVLFFKQENFHAFYDLLVLIKLSLSAVTMAFYLEQRFTNRLSAYVVIALGMSFGLMQYNLEQARNIMWLDGVYMMPLILWGVYQVSKGKTIFYIVIPAAFSLMFNWYSGLIDLLFTGFWTIWETILLRISSHCTWKQCIFFLFRAALSILLALGIVSIIFVPTLMELANGRTSHFDWRLLRAVWKGSFTSLFTGVTWGTFSSNGHASLFCGSLTLLGMIGFFFKKNLARDIRFFTVLMLVFSIAILYWQPFFLLFSLLKDASSYWYRYSYVTIFFFIWLAGAFFSNFQNKYAEWKIGICIPLLWIVLQLHRTYNTWGNIIGTSALLICLIVILYCCRNDKYKKCSGIILVVLTCLDLGCNGNYILRHQDVFHGVQAYQDYVAAEKEQVASIVPVNSDFYRISQTSTFLFNPNDKIVHITANYNEGMAYLYPTIASYTSSPVNYHLNFLDRLGYRRNGDNMNIVNTSLLGTDSLLGVKYVLADYAIPGLVLAPENKVANKKAVYENPYVMPIAFRISKNVAMHHLYKNNPFQFTNELYADVFQQNNPIYKLIAYQQDITDDQKKSVFYVNAGDTGAVYGNFPDSNKNRNAMLVINDSIYQKYSDWLSPSTFFIPMNNGVGKVEWQSKKESADVLEKVQYYQVDENALMTASTMAWANAATIQRESDTHLRISVNAGSNEMLFTSIPTHKGWHVICNGEVVKPKAFEDCLMVIPLQPGHNTITLDFELPGCKLGAILTLCSLLVCGIFWKWKI